MNRAHCVAMLVAMIGSVALSGCGEPAPTDKNVQDAMARQLARLMGKEAVESQKEELAKIKVLRCVKAELGGFNCEIDSPVGGRSTGRFKKEGDGWMFVGNGG